MHIKLTTRMISTLGSLLVWCLSFAMIQSGRQVLAQEAQRLSETRSRVVQDLVIALGNEAGTLPYSVETRFYYTFYCFSNQVQTVLVPRNLEYFCEAILVNRQGEVVPRSKLGEKTRSHFRDLANSYPVRHQRIPDRMGCFRIPVFQESVGTHCQSWVRPKDLFDIKVPGIYTLRLEFQILLLEHTAATNHFKLVRFPEIQCSIVKE